jgi:hypothetical protein
VRDEDNFRKPQLNDHGIEVSDLIGSGIRIAEGFIRRAPAKKIKGNNSTRWREIRKQTVVEMQIVREPVHQDDRRLFAWVFADADSMLIPPYETLSVAHHSFQAPEGAARILASYRFPPVSPPAVNLSSEIRLGRMLSVGFTTNLLLPAALPLG